MKISRVPKRVDGSLQMGRATKKTLEAVYARLLKKFGPQQWWPAETKFEVIVGALLTQNTNWGNVEKALNNLKKNNLLSPQALRKISPRDLSAQIKPSGYFNVKAKRLKNFISFLFTEYNGSLQKASREDYRTLRQKLLRVNGIGPETADSILLYAFDKPVFVVDAYTKRILTRHNIVNSEDDYHDVQKIFMESLKRDVRIFNEYHALIVRLGKDFCKPKPLCEQCLLRDFHYSLTNKCGQCHRALPLKQGRHTAGDGYLCAECQAIVIARRAKAR